MNKYTIITSIAIAAIIFPFVYSGTSILGTNQLEYRWNSPGDFSFFTMSNNGEIEFCNTIPFWISFQKFEIISFYDSENVGVFTVDPATINPLASSVQKGVFLSNEFISAQHLFMTLDFEFDGGDIRVDPNKLIVVIRTETPIIGIIPYSTTTQITGFDFDKNMNSEDLSCD